MRLDPREQKRRLLMRLKGVESGRPVIGPQRLQFHITEICNIHCKYCWYHAPGTDHRPTGKSHVPFDVFENVARDCADLKVDTIWLSGQGEPTVHPRFYDMLCHLQRTFEININTNGTFPLERCRDILRADRVIINLGEADREAYRELVGRDFFMRVIKNIRELARLRPLVNPNFSIEVLFVTTRLNAQSLARTETLVRKLGADVVHKREFEESPFNLDMMLPGQGRKTAPLDPWLPCYFGWFNSSIKFNGDVTVCCFMQNLTIGNAFAASFKDVWESEAYQRARILALKGEDPFRNDRACTNCSTACTNREIAGHLETYNRVRMS